MGVHKKLILAVLFTTIVVYAKPKPSRLKNLQIVRHETFTVKDPASCAKVFEEFPVIEFDLIDFFIAPEDYQAQKESLRALINLVEKAYDGNLSARAQILVFESAIKGSQKLLTWLHKETHPNEMFTLGKLLEDLIAKFSFQEAEFVREGNTINLKFGKRELRLVLNDNLFLDITYTVTDETLGLMQEMSFTVSKPPLNLFKANASDVKKELVALQEILLEAARNNIKELTIGRGLIIPMGPLLANYNGLLRVSKNLLEKGGALNDDTLGLLEVLGKTIEKNLFNFVAVRARVHKWED